MAPLHGSLTIPSVLLVVQMLLVARNCPVHPLKNHALFSHFLQVNSSFFKFNFLKLAQVAKIYGKNHHHHHDHRHHHHHHHQLSSSSSLLSIVIVVITITIIIVIISITINYHQHHHHLHQHCIFLCAFFRSLRALFLPSGDF